MKTRVTFSLPSDLAAAADELARRRGRPRSAVIEEALRLLLRQQRAAEVAASLDAYYGALTAPERDEEAAMVAGFHRSQRRVDLDGPRPRRRAARR
jgi:predicted transcriptional regulator